MQPIFRLLIKLARDLDNIGDGNIRIIKSGTKVQMLLPGHTIKCDYLAPWLKRNIKNGVITGRHRIEYVNAINELFAKYKDDDSSLYLECIKGVINVYELSYDDKSVTYLRSIKLVPIDSWLLRRLLCDI